MSESDQQEIVSPEIVLRNYDMLINKLTDRFTNVYSTNERVKQGIDMASRIKEYVEG